MTDSNVDQRNDQAPVPPVAFTIRPIGLVHLTSRKRTRTPRYFVPKGRTTLELFHPYLPGLQGFYGGAEIWVITYHAPYAAKLLAKG